LVSELNAARDHGFDAKQKQFNEPLESREGLHSLPQTDVSTSVDGEYSFKDLVDMESLCKVLEKFSSATGFTAGLVSFPTQEVLIATGWKEVCTKFHRAFPESARHCRQSNIELTKRLRDFKQLNTRACGNGMVDGATPVIVNGKHVASLFTGQCLFEEPDVNQFRNQATTYGYDVDEYLEALSKVRVVSKEEFEAVLSFLSEFAVFIAEQGLSRLKLKRRTWKLEREITHRRGAQDSLQEARNALMRRVERLKKELTETDEHRKKEIAERLDVEEALRKSEMNLAAAQKIAQIGHWTLDPETGEVEGSDELFRILGLTREEATLNAFVEAVHRDDREYYLRHIRRGMEHGESWDIEHRLIRKDGTQKWVHARGEAVVDGTGKTVQLQGTAQEITERKRVEVELRQSERRHRTLFERARDAIMIIDIEGDNLGSIVDANQVAAETHGYELAELLTLKIHDLDTAESAERIPERIKHILKGEWLREVTTHRRKDGSVFPIELSGGMVELGNHKYALAIDRDITERKRFEEALRESEDKFRALSDSSFEAIFLSEKGVCIGQNLSAEKMFGYSAEEALGRSVTEWIAPEGRGSDLDHILSGDEGPYEAIAIKKDGTTFPCEIQGKIIRHEGRSIRVTALRDNT
jgi:PAS domain S-box-containing protein